MRLMKTFTFCILILLVTLNAIATDVKVEINKRIKFVPYTNLPFSNTKTIGPSFRYALIEDQIANLPMFLYDDITLTDGSLDLKWDPNMECAIICRFPTDTDFDLVALDIESAEWGKNLLAVYKNGRLIDYIEAEISWDFTGGLYVKQWRITANREIVVTWLKINSPAPIRYNKDYKFDFNTLNAQRIDTHYKIDDTGHFKVLKQIKYRPQDYSQADLARNSKNLWEGNEVEL